DDAPDGVIDLLLRGEAAEAEADGGVGLVVGQPHRLEDVAGAGRAAGTGRAGRAGDVVHVADEGAGVHADEGDVAGVGESVGAVAVDPGVRELGKEGVFELVAQPANSLSLLVHFKLGDPARLAEADDAGDVERTTAEAAFLAAANDKGLQL